MAHLDRGSNTYKGYGKKGTTAPQRNLPQYAWLGKLYEILNPFAELQKLSSHLKTGVEGQNFVDDLAHILNDNMEFSSQAMTILRDGVNTLLQTDGDTDLNHLKQKIAERYGSDPDPVTAFQYDFIQHIDNLHMALLAFENSHNEALDFNIYPSQMKSTVLG
ncbi:MAG: hypothetical protein ACKO43_07495 [Alphaproteobacteria bacterium]